MAYKVRTVQATFNGGEISPSMTGRIDLERWTSSLALCSNMIPKPEGGVTRRTGTRYVAPVKETNDANTVLLFPFVFNDVQAYVLELGEFYVRFFMNDGQLYGAEAIQRLVTESGDQIVTETSDALVLEDLDPDAQPYEISSPYSASAIRRLQFTQTGDVMYLACAGLRPRTLSRLGHTNWSIDLFAFRNGPWRPLNDTAVTITPSATTGSGTLTASSDLFDAGHVGALWRIEDEDQAAYGTWEPGKAYGLNDQVWYNGNVYLCFDAGTSGAVAPVHLDGDRYDGEKASACGWRFLHSGFGIVEITGVMSATSATMTVVSRLPSTSATTKWREGAWSDYRGWPTAVALFEQRLWWAREQTVWGSVAGDFTDYALGTVPDDAITFTINGRTANPITSMIGGPGGLVLLTRAGEWVVESVDGEPLSAEVNFTVRPYTSEGAAQLPPILVDNTVTFVGRTGRRLHQLVFDWQTEGYRAPELTVMARHMLRPGG